jgi:NCAIR mutase (PurE)-related protein
MNRFQAIGRLAVLVAGLAGALPTLCAGCMSVAVAKVPLGGPHHHSGPARVHAVLASTIPGWQLTLMAVTIVLLAGTLVAIVYPGPGRAVTGKRTHGPTG